ncbi:MAG: hypothetical protein ACR2L6_13480 [Gemmatimonadaceae bacterium]
MLRILTAVVFATAAAGCGPRQVQVETGTSTSSREVALRVTNNLSQAVNVYISGGGTSDVFVKQIGANSSEWVPVQGFSAGAIVTLRARTVDGVRTYQKDNVMLESMYEWRVP